MNRFAKIFWPKEVSKLVDKYREDGSLNQEAHDSLETIPLGHFVGFFCIGIIMLLISEPEMGIGLILFSPIFVRIDLWFLFKNRIATYSHGFRKKVKVVKVGGGFYGSRRLVFFDDDKKKYIVKSARGIAEPDSKLPNEADIVEINYDPNKKYGATLNLPHLRKIYSLTTNFNQLK
jgi:hypothetical protein